MRPAPTRADGYGGPAPLLLFSGVSKRFGGMLAVDDVTLDLGAGEIMALLGENGAGKSTTIKMLAGIDGEGVPRAVAAGDGSESAYQRIRGAQYQAVTVAGPLNLQGRQLVDELNRAFAGDEWSGYASPLHVVTADYIEFDGGPTDVFDPENGYRDEYKKIWGK